MRKPRLHAAFSVSSLNSKINIHTNSARIKNYFQKDPFVEESIAGYRFNKKPMPNAEYSLSYFDGKEKLSFQKKAIRLSAPINNLHFPDLVYLALFLLEKQHGLDRKFTTHGAAFGKNENAGLLLGDSGNGKTTVLLNLYLRNYTFLSNDKTVIGSAESGPAIFAGTNYLSIRPSIYSGLNKETLDIIEPLIIGKTEKGKIILDLKWTPDQTNPPKISSIFFISLLDDSKTLIFNKLSKDMASLLLARETSTYLRGASGVVITLNRQFPSFDNMEISANRMNLIESIVSKADIFVLRANLQNIVRTIGEVFEAK
ncbi:hypothetical protein COU37_00115 [Candidatus Micrarchaeota archaeon CG10_big_fil_rev_8_21_14_0_10_45_29]|nr:MAG: hypothetical protein COU37_00115 [Candidatus Micrarchaeota archaeon CG10_big_fil_rev_8_21_14_0_10_45_29]